MFPRGHCLNQFPDLVILPNEILKQGGGVEGLWERKVCPAWITSQAVYRKDAGESVTASQTHSSGDKTVLSDKLSGSNTAQNILW